MQGPYTISCPTVTYTKVMPLDFVTRCVKVENEVLGPVLQLQQAVNFRPYY